MREIKCRGLTPNGTWAYGDWIKENMRPPMIMVGYCEYSNVDPETVGQYTGLKDKNGVEIYEGDIIKWRVFIFAVVWNEEYGCFGPSLRNGHDVLGKYLYSDKAEIIGNIHENKELLNNDNP